MKVIMFLILALLISCSSAPKPADCLGERNSDIKIIWGVITDNGNRGHQYTLKSDRTISMDSIPYLDGKSRHVADIPRADEFCSIYTDLMNLMLKVQALNVPAETNHFIEFVNPRANYRFRALWNPVHTNHGNKEFKEIYNRLEEFISVNQHLK